jgi:hypothetical protein
MDALNFAYWLQGLLELSPELKTLNEEQVSQIRSHLNLVFTNVTKPKNPFSPATPWNPGTGTGFQPYPPYPTVYCSTSKDSKERSSLPQATFTLTGSNEK